MVVEKEIFVTKNLLKVIGNYTLQELLRVVENTLLENNPKLFSITECIYPKGRQLITYDDDNGEMVDLFTFDDKPSNCRVVAVEKNNKVLLFSTDEIAADET